MPPLERDSPPTLTLGHTRASSQFRIKMKCKAGTLFFEKLQFTTNPIKKKGGCKLNDLINELRNGKILTNIKTGQVAFVEIYPEDHSCVP